MLGENTEKTIELLEVGELTAVIKNLEGAMIVRLEERIPSKLNPLEAVEERATALALRKAKTIAWDWLIDELKVC